MDGWVGGWMVGWIDVWVDGWMTLLNVSELRVQKPRLQLHLCHRKVLWNTNHFILWAFISSHEKHQIVSYDPRRFPSSTVSQDTVESRWLCWVSGNITQRQKNRQADLEMDSPDLGVLLLFPNLSWVHQLSFLSHWVPNPLISTPYYTSALPRSFFYYIL